MNVYVELINAKRLQRKLSSIAKVKDRRSIVRKASRESAKPLYRATKSAAPIRSGVLKSSIKLRAAKKSRTRIGVNVIIRKIDWKKAETKGLTKNKGKRSGKNWKVFYAAFVEFGTIKQKANPFMKRVAKQHGKAVVRDFMKRVFKLIEQAAKK